MKRPSNAFTLVKNMTMSEKRYFKIFSERHTIGEKNKYVAIFDLLDASEIEKDDEIKTALRKKKINSDFLSADRNYLYNLMLKSLNDFHYSKTHNLEVKELLLSVEVLFHKGLYSECLKLISRAETLAQECENFALMIDILMWKKKCSGYSLGLYSAAAVNKEIDKYTGLLINLKDYTDLYYESNILQSDNEKTSRSEVRKQFSKIMTDPLLKNEKNASSFSSLIFYRLIHANFFNISEEREKELQVLQKLVDSLNSSATYPAENPLDYVSIYGRLLSIKKFFDRDSFFREIGILKEFRKKNVIKKEEAEQRVFIHCNTNEIEFYLINNEFEQALSKIKEVENKIGKADLKVEPFHLIYFFYLHAIVLIYVGQFSRALRYINKVLNNFVLHDRPQVFARIEILNAIVHFELRNFKLANTLSKKILKKEEIRKYFLPMELRLTECLLEISSSEDFSTREEIKVWKALQEEMETEKSKISFSQQNLLENYSKWIAAKIQRKIVAEINFTK